MSRHGTNGQNVSVQPTEEEFVKVSSSGKIVKLHLARNVFLPVLVAVGVAAGVASQGGDKDPPGRHRTIVSSYPEAIEAGTSALKMLQEDGGGQVVLLSTCPNLGSVSCPLQSRQFVTALLNALAMPDGHRVLLWGLEKERQLAVAEGMSASQIEQILKESAAIRDRAKICNVDVVEKACPQLLNTTYLAVRTAKGRCCSIEMVFPETTAAAMSASVNDDPQAFNRAMDLYQRFQSQADDVLELVTSR